MCFFDTLVFSLALRILVVVAIIVIAFLYTTTLYRLPLLLLCSGMLAIL
jgi:hypothetical protein